MVSKGINNVLEKAAANADAKLFLRPSIHAPSPPPPPRMASACRCSRSVGMCRCRLEASDGTVAACIEKERHANSSSVKLNCRGRLYMLLLFIFDRRTATKELRCRWCWWVGGCVKHEIIKLFTFVRGCTRCGNVWLTKVTYHF